MSKDTEDDVSDDGAFLNILKNIMAGNPQTDTSRQAAPSAGFDTNALMLMMMDKSEKQAERQAAEARRSSEMMMSLVGTALSTLAPLFLGKKDDSATLKLMEIIANKDSTKDLFAGMIAMTTQNANAQVESMRKSTEMMMETKDRFNDKLMERMEQKIDESNEAKGPTMTGNSWVDGLTQLNHLAGKIPSILGKGDAAAPAVAGPATNPPPGSTAPRLPAPPASAPAVDDDRVIGMILVALRRLHLVTTMTQRQRQMLRAQVVAAIVGVPALCDAIIDEDMASITALCGKAAESNAEVLGWIATPAAQGWITAYLAQTILPALLDIVEGEQTDGGDGDDDGDGEEAVQPAGVPTGPEPEVLVLPPQVSTAAQPLAGGIATPPRRTAPP